MDLDGSWRGARLSREAELRWWPGLTHEWSTFVSFYPVSSCLDRIGDNRRASDDSHSQATSGSSGLASGPR